MFMHIQSFIYVTQCWIEEDLFQDEMDLLIEHFLQFGPIKMQLITEHLP